MALKRDGISCGRGFLDLDFGSTSFERFILALVGADLEAMSCLMEGAISAILERDLTFASYEFRFQLLYTIYLRYFVFNLLTIAYRE